MAVMAVAPSLKVVVIHVSFGIFLTPNVEKNIKFVVSALGGRLQCDPISLCRQGECALASELNESLHSRRPESWYDPFAQVCS